MRAPAWWTDDAGWWTYLLGVAVGIALAAVVGPESAATGVGIVAAVRAGSQLRRHRTELHRDLYPFPEFRIVDRSLPTTTQLAPLRCDRLHSRSMCSPGCPVFGYVHEGPHLRRSTCDETCTDAYDFPGSGPE